ncbi:MAG: hypothetical protein JNL60_00840 [Bacteroidia bacterium]|nr:hypothetical protein [Bacteroidia bacterium]
MKKLIILSLMFVLSGLINLASAQSPKVVISDKKGWHKIGETTVDFSKDHDEITVLGADRFASLIFRVEEAPVNLMEIEVFYESGDNQKVNVNFPIKAPGQSKEIDIKGGERSIRKIVFVYKTLPNRKDNKAHIEIWGLKTNA